MDDRLDATLRQFQEVLVKHQTFLLSGHVNIDGDSLGSMLGLAHYLRAAGKQVTPLVLEPIAERYEFLDPDGFTQVFDPRRHGELARTADVFIMFDFSSPSRIPGVWDLVKSGRAFKVCVDHHRTDILPGDLNIHDAAAPATGKIVLDVLRSLGATIDKRIAEALLVAIATDTGWFRYSNTSAEVLKDAAELLATGLDGHRIYREIYQRNDVALIRLMGRVAASVHDELGSRLLWAVIPRALIDELGVGTFETDELLDILRTGREAECVALFREEADGTVRVNLRSRGRLDVSEIARKFSGGGHRHAAGATIHGPLNAVAERVVSHLRQALAVPDREAVPHRSR